MEEVAVMTSPQAALEENKSEKAEDPKEQEENPENKDKKTMQLEASPEVAIIEEDEPFVENTEPELTVAAPERKSTQPLQSSEANALEDLNQWIVHYCSSTGGLNGKNQFLRIKSGLLIRDSNLTHFIKGKFRV